MGVPILENRSPWAMPPRRGERQCDEQRHTHARIGIISLGRSKDKRGGAVALERGARKVTAANNCVERARGGCGGVWRAQLKRR